jgi:hypothetical protein
MARWKRLVERQFPQQAASTPAGSSQRSGQQNNSYTNSGTGRGRGGGGASRGSRGSSRGGSSNQNFRGTGSRVNPRPASAGPPAKVYGLKNRKTTDLVYNPWRNHENS